MAHKEAGTSDITNGFLPQRCPCSYKLSFDRDSSLLVLRIRLMFNICLPSGNILLGGA